MRLALSVLVAVVLCSAIASDALASPCVEGGERVEVIVEGGSDAFRTSLRRELAVELARAKLCAAGVNEHSNEPLAHIHVTLRGDASASVRIDDAVTKKTLEREVDVAALPPDGRVLPIAIAADELLRASWAEITLHPEAAASNAVPVVVRASVAQPPADARPTSHAAVVRPASRVVAFARANEIGVRATVGAYSGGQTHLGGSLYARRDLVAWLSGEIFGYAREGMPVTATDGAIRTHAWGGGLSLDVHAIRAGAARFGVRVGTEVGAVRFEGRAHAGAQQATFTGLSAFGHLGLVAAFEVARVRVSAALLGLAPFRAVRALDGMDIATSVGGVGVQAALGAGVAF